MAASRGKGGRKLSYVATVQGNGNLLVGKAYTAMLDLQPGDEFEIKLGRKRDPADPRRLNGGGRGGSGCVIVACEALHLRSTQLHRWR